MATEPTVQCAACEDCFWVCENHEDKPWDGPNACKCGGAGMPCLKCNPCDGKTPPKELADSTTYWDINNGWRQ